MNNNNENKLVPKLRFPEFLNEEEWEEDIVDNLVLTITPPKKLSSSNYQVNGKFPIIDQSKNYYCGWTNDIEAIITNDLPLIIFGDHTCIIKIAKEPFAQGADGIKILRTKNKIFPEYLFHYLQRIKVVIENYKRHFSILKDKIVVFPNSDSGEQQKIAACLSSLDEVITAESQKLELLKEHKKGLLQNLFPQEGETVPKLRFKEFDSSDEWVEKKIGDLFTFKQGVQVPVENQFHSKNDGMVRFIRIIDITNSAEPERYIENPGNNHLICKNDLFMIRYGTPGLISIGYDGVIANNLFRLIWNNNEFYKSKFWYFVFQRIEKFIYDLSTSSSMPAISFSTLEGISLLYPKNTSEQQKIAETLSSLDDLITAQSQKIEALKMHKKGLLQGLFPDVNEVDLSNLRSLKTDQN
jgi:type I restriction enzyme S subunit